MISEKKAIVAGSGFAGAVAARELADAGWDVTVLERRGHIGGNAYDETDAAGIGVHLYGPHIFHTSDRAVLDWLSRFTRWRAYEHRVKGDIGGVLVPIPFNYGSIDALFSRERANLFKKSLAYAYPGRERISILDLQQDKDGELRALGEYIFEHVFVHYTAKQWGVPANEVSRTVIDRVPVVLGYDDRYFRDQFQCMPTEGFAPLFAAILDHPRIAVHLNTDVLDVLELRENTLYMDGVPYGGAVVYTGAIDALFDYRHGPLPYRAVDFRFETLDAQWFQSAAVVNYPGATPEFTRITEMKYLTGQTSEQTTILREYPMDFDHRLRGGPDPSYPVENALSAERYGRYHADAVRVEGLYLCGRLAEFRYYNMDAVVAASLAVAREILQAGI